MRQTIVFAGERTIEVTRSSIPTPAANEVLVQTRCSAISAGTELLLYRGQLPHDIPLDPTIPGMTAQPTYPTSYGYSLAGTVIECGEHIDPTWQGRRVFCLHHHTSHFVCSPERLLPIPDAVTDEQAALFPATETAVNFILDGAPLLDEQVIIFGQGIIGLLTTAILSRYPLHSLTTIDPILARRQRSLQAGATRSIAPDAPLQMQADLIYELSGSPAALNRAISLAAYSGRVVIGSWYGTKPAPLDLGSAFHRNRITLISSQVSTISPHLRGRWDHNRRYNTTWDMIAQIKPERWITHRMTIDRAAEAYQLLDRQPEDLLQLIFTYPEEP